jgi:zinc transport system ATP-binding protein
MKPTSHPHDAERTPDSRPGNAPILIEARDISLRLGARDVLQGINLEVRAGEIVTLVGPNGAGKTSLVRVLLGILRPSRGEVRRKSGLRIGYLPQRLRINEHLPLSVSGLLSLALPGRWPWWVGKTEREAKPAQERAIRAALEETGAAHLERSPLHELSGGEAQRVLLARTLLRQPELLILDEPVQGVDVGGQLDLYRRITDLRGSRGCGVLLVSHDLHLVMSATHRVICLNGHICCSGHPDTVRKDPAYLGLFGPAAADGLAVYAHEHDHSHDPPQGDSAGE